MSLAAELGRLAGVRALVVGDVMLDRYWHGAVERISPEAPVPVVAVHRQDACLGGAANVARNVVALGARATLVGVVGDDAEGREVRALADHAGIATALVRDAGIATTQKLRVLARHQQLVRIDFETRPGAAALDALHDAVVGALGQADVLILSDYGKGTLARVAALIAAGRAAGVPVVVDPKGHDYARYAGAALITPNRQEFATVAGPWEDEAAFCALGMAWQARLGVDRLLVTRSEEGMTLFCAPHAPLHAPARAREVFDVSGAGDTVLAVVSLALRAGLAHEGALHLANLAAGVVVGKLGTATASPAEILAAATVETGACT